MAMGDLNTFSRYHLGHLKHDYRGDVNKIRTNLPVFLRLRLLDPHPYSLAFNWAVKPIQKRCFLE